VVTPDSAKGKVPFSFMIISFCRFWVGVSELGFQIAKSGFQVSGFELRLLDRGLGLGVWVRGSGLGVWVWSLSGVRVSGLGLRVRDLGFRVSGLGVWVYSLGVLGFQV